MSTTGPERIAIAMSGGVDSSVAALLLREQGHDVVAVSMRIHPESRCCDLQALGDAQRVAAALGMPYRVYDFVPEFRAAVIQPFVQAYTEGRTPSPCPDCNLHFKFGALLDAAQRDFGVVAIATGHYARRRYDPAEGRWQLLQGRDPRKDQSYMLARLRQDQLARARFPVGELEKPAVQGLAHAADLPLGDKPESQDACFINSDLGTFLRAELGRDLRPGAIVDGAGRVLGQHQGLELYTLGQRKGLLKGQAERLYVTELRPRQAEVVVGPLAATFSDSLRCERFSWLSLAPRDRLAVQVRVRAGAAPAPALLRRAGEGCRIDFEEAQPSVTPGQLAVVYCDEVVVGSGTISPRA